MIQLPSSGQPDTELIISIKQARKKLGKEAHGLTDDEIKDIVLTLQTLAKKHLSNKGSKNRSMLLSITSSETI